MGEEGGEKEEGKGRMKEKEGREGGRGAGRERREGR